MAQNDELLNRLLGIFRVEAKEHLRMLSSGLLDLEKNPESDRGEEIVECIFREAHSLKGAARAVNFKEIESVCQSLESVLAAIKGKSLPPSRPLFDILYQTIDVLEEMTAPETGFSGYTHPAAAKLIQRLQNGLQGHFDTTAQNNQSYGVRQSPDAGSSAPKPAPPPDVQPVALDPAQSAVKPQPPIGTLLAETIRVSSQKFDKAMRQVEELMLPRLAAEQLSAEMRGIACEVAQLKKRHLQLRPLVRTLDRRVNHNGTGKPLRELSRLLEYLGAETVSIKILEERVQQLCAASEHDRRNLSFLVDNLLHNVKDMYLQPFSSVVENFPRFVRKLALDQNKEVEMIIRGGEIEIDRRILEEMKDPLIHLLRNAVDHGIEIPDVRLEKSKPRQGRIAVDITQIDSGKVEILIADDGAGIDSDKVKAAALRQGGLTSEEAKNFTDDVARGLVFRSGISTSPIITDVSGRGLGLAIVQEKVERLGGAIALESGPGSGTVFRILLPMAMAVLRGLLVVAGGQFFILPLMSVQRVIRIKKEDIATLENRETVSLDGKAVSMVMLNDLLQMPGLGKGGGYSASPVVIVSQGPVRIALLVEEVLGEQEVVVKPLGSQLGRVRNIAGVSALGSGKLAPVLNVSDLIKTAIRRDSPATAYAPVDGAETAEERSILVVEDSITSRVLLKNILESGGYRVATAVDGADAFLALKTGRYDLVVSDVEMPRMDGFELTAKIRADKKLEKTPIVLVTALESPEHRERGIDVGADAYIVKSSFDQSNLLEVVRRII
ncbi:MAG: hybrid sensor histidine kinase/response regulator [Gammaproteobacteria bacterium]